MKTKFENIFDTLDDHDKNHIISLIPTKLMGGNEKHMDFILQAVSGKLKIPDNIPVKTRLIMSELYSMIEKYIIIRDSLKESYHAEKVLLRHFRKHENEKLFGELITESLQSLEKGNQNADYYHQISALCFEKWEFDQLQNRFSNSEAEDIIKNAEIAAISRQLMQTVALAPQSALLSRQINTGLAEHLIPYIQEKNLLTIPCISLYYYAWMMIRHPEDTSWFELFSDQLEKNHHQFPVEEQKTLYFQAINYCIRRHNSGDRDYSQRLLEYYKTALASKYLLTNGYLSKNTYRNINTIAIRMGQYQEAIEISNTYVSALRKEEQESAYNFNMANIHYSQKKYNNALEALRLVEFDDHLSNLFAKTLMLKIYYEMGAERLLDAHLDAMQVYLTRKKIIGYHKVNYANVIRYTRQLIKLKPFDRAGLAKLYEKVKAEKMLPDRDWMLRQLSIHTS